MERYAAAYLGLWVRMYAVGLPRFLPCPPLGAGRFRNLTD